MDFGNNGQNLLVLKCCSTVGMYEKCNSNLLTWACLLIIIYVHSTERLITSVYYVRAVVLYSTVLQFWQIFILCIYKKHLTR